MNHITNSIESLERRTLLANIGADLSFGQSGLVTTTDSSLLIAPLTGGKVLAVGRAGTFRLNSDGSIDPTFVDRGGGVSSTRDPQAALVVGQQLFVAGTDRIEDGANTSTSVRKINLSNGSPSTGFGVNGVLNFVPKHPDTGYFNIADAGSMIATSDGGLIVAVKIYVERGQAIAVHKFDATGDAVTTFGDNGAILVDVPQDVVAYVDSALLAAMSDGRFYLLNESSLRLHRFKADGSVDTTFGTNGIVALEGAPFNMGTSVNISEPLVQPDGKVIVPLAGQTSGGRQRSYLVRFTTSGARDTTFSGDGTVEVPQDWGQATAWDLALDSAGRIVGVSVAGHLIRVMPDGTFDPTFDDDGFAGMDATSDYRINLALDADERLLIGKEGTIWRYRERVGPGLAQGTMYIDGTENDDTISASLAGDEYTITFNGESSTYSTSELFRFEVTGAAGDDQITLDVPVRATVFPGDGDDSIRTGSAEDFIMCLAGADTVDAGAGRDIIFGGDGNDSLYGNAGDDKIFGDLGNDSLSGGDDNDRLFGGLGYGSSDTDGADSLSGNAGRDTVCGGSQNDRVAGNGGRDRTFGDAGDDRIYGGASGDWLYGGAGADQLFGEGGLDRLYGNDNDSARDILHGNAGDDILFAQDTFVDELFGDGGTDSAVADEADVLTSIEG